MGAEGKVGEGTGWEGGRGRKGRGKKGREGIVSPSPAQPQFQNPKPATMRVTDQVNDYRVGLRPSARLTPATASVNLDVLRNQRSAVD